jgi:hypothetical protein
METDSSSPIQPSISQVRSLDSFTPLPHTNVQTIQAALNLIELSATKGEDIDTLVDALMVSKEINLYPWHVHADYLSQTQADDSLISFMAKGNFANFQTGKLDEKDKISLRAMLAMVDTMGDKIRQLLQPGESEMDSTFPPSPTSQSNAPCKTSESSNANILAVDDSKEQESVAATASPRDDIEDTDAIVPIKEELQEPPILIDSGAAQVQEAAIDSIPEVATVDVPDSTNTMDVD